MCKSHLIRNLSEARHDFDTRATQNDEKRRQALQDRIMALTWDDASSHGVEKRRKHP